MSKTSIEWAGSVWNSILGCSKCSPRCANCYAIREVARERCEAHKGLAILKPVRNWTGLIRFVPERLSEPLRRTKPTTWFVNSLSDFFHEAIPIEWQIAGLEVMRMADWHIFQILAKREDELHRLLNDDLKEYADLPNIMWGVSVEDRKFGLPRIDALRQSPAKIRWLSIEPLLEDLGEINLDGIHWVVVGGESGWDARPMKEEWVWPIKEQCDAAGVPFFFKQWGGVNKKKTGRLLGGRTYDEFLKIVLNQCPERKIRRARVSEAENLASEIKLTEVWAKEQQAKTQGETQANQGDTEGNLLAGSHPRPRQPVLNAHPVTALFQ